ncbi:hypothetical protein GYMLUDRAFT_151370 [Collybiopsis luxurians FD-317 M1]|nr:hypothetical protein GYMLUDRAFT_151370 [Collybiopsis luxurians FD-317 M1]
MLGNDFDINEENLDEGHPDENPEEQPNVNEETANTEGHVKKKRERKEAGPLTREAGKSLLPFSRVQKIIKADKDIPIIARDATFLISLAAEEFIKRLCQAGQRVAEKEKRSTVQYKDLTTVVRKADEFMFLDEIISLVQPIPPQKRVPKALSANKTGGVATSSLLDTFMTKTDMSKVALETQDVVMNEDGSMVSGNGQE